MKKDLTPGTIYAAFLQGVGYEPIGWREAETV